MRSVLNWLFTRLTPLGAIVASVAAILIGPRLLTIVLSGIPERYAPSAGLFIPLMVLSIAITFLAVTHLFTAWHWLSGRIRDLWYDRLGISRAIVRVGDRDIDAWIDEGLAAYGSVNRVVSAGVVAGLLFPWLTVVLGGYVYNLATGLYADSLLSGLAGTWGPSFGLSGLTTTAFLGAFGGLFALVKRAALRRSLANPFGRFRGLYNTQFVGTLLGVLFIALLGALPQSADSREVIVVIIIVGPVWAALGFALNVYFHWFHTRLLRLLHVRDWKAAVTATTRRLLIGHLGVTSPCTIKADPDTGGVAVDHFPVEKGSSRLVELVMRIPGVEKVTVDEVGEGKTSDSAILTIYTGLGDSAKPVRLLASAGWLPMIGGGLGAAFYLFGTAYLFVRGLVREGLTSTLSQGALWMGQAGLLKQGVIIGLVGWAVGYMIHRVIRNKEQKRLPIELQAALASTHVEMTDFRPGDSDWEIHVAADLTRRQAIELLGPVAAKYGVKRILLTTSAEAADATAEPADVARRA